MVCPLYRLNKLSVKEFLFFPGSRFITLHFDFLREQLRSFYYGSISFILNAYILI